MMRRKIRRIGAQTPITAWVGSMPIRAVAPPMPTSVSTRIILRPYLSPRWPATMAPRGRNRKLMPREAQETTCASGAFSSASGAKNRGASTKAAAWA